MMTTEEIRQELEEARRINSELVMEALIRRLLKRGYQLANPNFTWDDVEEQ
jgi:hypothetical protein